MRRRDPPHEIFKLIDMKHGDKDECWEWPGRMSPNPVTRLFGREVQVRRLVYSLKHGMHIDDVPTLSFKCGNPRCVNSHHAVPFAAIAGVIGSIKKTKENLTHAEAASRANMLKYTKRNKNRKLTKRSEDGTFSKKRKEIVS